MTKTPTKKTLDEFSPSKTGRAKGCWVCSIPERADIDTARRNDTHSVAVITRWLRGECGYDEATISKLAYHFKMEHHLS